MRRELHFANNDKTEIAEDYEKGGGGGGGSTVHIMFLFVFVFSFHGVPRSLGPPLVSYSRPTRFDATFVCLVTLV